MKWTDFTHLKPGDLVIRKLAGKLPMTMIVREVTDTLIICDTKDCRGGWTFDRKTGIEEDEDLQWGVRWGRTGSFLTDDPVVS